MSSRSGRHPRSRSRSRSRDSRRSSRRDGDRPWLKRSRSRSASGSSSSRSQSRSPRRRSRRSRSKSPVRPVMSKDPKYLNSRVFVANLASDQTSSSELQSVFEKHGRVVDTLVHHNGYGFVQFSNEEDARKSVAAETGTVFHGKSLKCNMAAEGKRGGGGGGNSAAGRGGGYGGMERGGPPPDDRSDRFARDRSPGRDPYGPPFDSPYMRGRELPPHPRDLPPMRDLPPPPRDPYFDDPYRRPPPPDLYFDRFRDDPFRRDPYALDPYRDPYRDPFASSLYDIPPKKPVTVDCEIIVMSADLRRYADMVEQRLKNINLLTNIVVIREDRTIQQQVEDATRRSCLFAIVINSQNEIHRSLTLNILHGVAQEHRNMPLDDCLSLVARSFEKFLKAEKEKVAALNPKPASGSTSEDAKPGSVTLPSKEISYLLNLLADNRQLTADELDKVIVHLRERRDKMLEAEGRPPASPQVQQAVSTVPQQQQPQQQPQQHQQQELQNKILSIMNGSTSVSTVSPSMSVPQHTAAPALTTPLMPASMAAQPPPPPPQAPTTPHVNPAQGATSPPSLSLVQGVSTAATLINFDNPTVQKALDNLIQSGPNLLRNISATAGAQGGWPGQGTSVSTSSRPAGVYPASAGLQRPPY